MGITHRKKGFDYFESFRDVAEIARKSANYLDDALRNFDVKNIETYAQTMHTYENDADAKKHELCKHLAQEFMPPIGREDITLLSQELDNIVDMVEDVMRKIYMLNIKEIRGEAREFTKLTAEACAVFYNMMCEFPNFKKSKTLHNFIVEINTIENKGDKLHAESVRSLFLDSVSASDQLAWIMIFESLENGIDACESAADIIEGIITKNT